MTHTQPYDVIVYGATSFVGQILTRYLAQYTVEEVNWAIAGRNQAKLNTLKAEVNLPDLPTLIADSQDETALRQLCDSGKVIISTVGPYALFGSLLVKLCAETGTDYCDLTGEPQWIMKMIAEHEDAARASGARLVHCSGFDSIPSDLGVYFTQAQAQAKFGVMCQQIKMRVRRIKGGASGGTIASMFNVLNEAKKDPSLKKALINPYCLCPADHGFTMRQTYHKGAAYEADTGYHTMPFVMAAINERIVHRSNALQDNRYGDLFKYDEAMTAKNSRMATKMTLGLGMVMGMANFSATRWILEKFLPKPGEGPSEKEQLNGMFDMRFIGNTGKDIIEVKVTGDRDPGYGSTAKMLAQTGLHLALDEKRVEGGSWTPAVAGGEVLIERLVKHAGLTFDVVTPVNDSE